MHDLLWQPDTVTEKRPPSSTLHPDVVLSDQIAYGASLALRSYASLLVGHPTSLLRPPGAVRPPALAVLAKGTPALRADEARRLFPDHSVPSARASMASQRPARDYSAARQTTRRS